MNFQPEDDKDRPEIMPVLPGEESGVITSYFTKEAIKEKLGIPQKSTKSSAILSNKAELMSIVPTKKIKVLPGLSPRKNVQEAANAFLKKVEEEEKEKEAPQEKPKQPLASDISSSTWSLKRRTKDFGKIIETGEPKEPLSRLQKNKILFAQAYKTIVGTRKLYHAVLKDGKRVLTTLHLDRWSWVEYSLLLLVLLLLLGCVYLLYCFVHP